MSLRNLAGAAVGALALGLMAVPAAAAGVTTYTFTGLAQVYTDNTGMFGDVNGENDRSFTAVFTRLNDFDPSLENTDGATYSIVREQANFSDPQSTVLSSFTMGGVTINLDDRAGSQSQENSAFREGFSFYTDSFSDQTFDDGSRLYTVDFLSFDVFGFGTDYLASHDFRTLPSLTRAATPGFNWSGKLQILQERTDPFGVVSTRTVLADLIATRVDVVGALPVGPGVPEPGTWTVLILGFAGVGAALRRHSRRRREATLFAA